jgi:3-isopropylmalate/(R)-2-methylmalate dehydratase small subunit
MQKFTAVTGIAAPLMKANIDTDVIIPAKCLVGHRRDQLGAFCFEAYRYRPDRSENPDFVLNQSRYRSAQVLVTGENFGCGSSRESAVWALAGIGMRCVIAPGFGDIFFNNAFQNGMLLIRLPKEQVEQLAAELESAATSTVTVDLQKQIIALPVDAERRQALLEGRDEIGITLTRDAEIRAFQQRDRDVRPWVYQTLPRTKLAT